MTYRISEERLRLCRELVEQRRRDTKDMLGGERELGDLLLDELDGTIHECRRMIAILDRHKICEICGEARGVDGVLRHARTCGHANDGAVGLASDSDPDEQKRLISHAATLLRRASCATVWTEDEREDMRVIADRIEIHE